MARGAHGGRGPWAYPSHHWAGLHAAGPGAFQAIHRDFRRQPVTGLYHRVNVLLYLTRSWAPEWGGQLELWDPEMRACEQRIEPIGGRLVVFETSPVTLHGVPERVRCPDGTARLALAAYFYTDDPGPHDRRYSPYLRQPRRPGEPWWTGISVPLDSVHRLRQLWRRR